MEIFYPYEEYINYYRNRINLLNNITSHGIDWNSYLDDE